MKRIFSILLFFPYFNGIDLGVDSSLPLIVLLFTISLFNAPFSYHRNFRYFVPITCLIVVLASIQFGIYRSIWSLRYAVSFVALLCSLLLVNRNALHFNSYIRKDIKWITAVYLTVFVLQLFGRVAGISVLEEFVPRLLGVVSSRTTENRGLTLLAPEPSYSGFYALLVWSYIVAKRHTMKLFGLEVKYYWILYAVSSLSASVILTILPMFIIFRVIKINRYLIVGLVSVLAIIGNANIRFVSLFSELVNNPDILLTDVSSASRIAALIVGPLSVLDLSNIVGLWGRDYFGYANYLFEHYFELHHFLTEGFSTSIKIKSTLSSVLYRFGLLGFIFLIGFAAQALRLSRINRHFRAFVIVIFAAWLVQVPFNTISYPFLFFLLVRENVGIKKLS